MFEFARIKLTAWYLLIIMLVSMSFSGVVYHSFTQELSRSLRQHSLQMLPDGYVIYPTPREGNSGVIESFFANDTATPLVSKVDLAVYEEVKKRLIGRLVVVNVAILIISGIAGYFLAGKTLQPIELMMDEQKRFIADASHELRTPLTAMKTEIEVALRDRKFSLTESKELLNSNLEEVDKMQVLTTYLLALSRYESHQIELPKEQINLKRCILQAIETVSPLAKAKQIKIEQKLVDLPVKVNSTSILELMRILMDNAIKYSGEKSKVIVALRKKRGTALITVQDFGLGIKASDLPYIFNRFYRSDLSRRKTSVDGYGLGLSIAKQIVGLHNGKISVVSEIDKGSLFTIHIPLH